MFSFFKTPLASLVCRSKELLRLSAKVKAYRRDVMSEEALASLEASETKLSTLLEKPSYTPLLEAYKALDTILKGCGGKVYPVSFVAENVEMLFVAAIIALGVRTFFFQPFKIPTNSMYPTYAGFLPKVYSVDEAKPNTLQRFVRKLSLGATYYDIQAPEAGPLSIALFSANERARFQSWAYYKLVKGRKYFGLVPELQREYCLFVGDRPLYIRTPEDFCLDAVLLEAYFPENKSFQDVLKSRPLSYSNKTVPTKLDTHLHVSTGQSCLSFEIQSGDMLFVNRMAYHFKSPKVGDPIVFKTGSLEAMHALLGFKEDKYYIKRLVGLEGDRLQIKPPLLYRNYKPIEGASAFESNAKQLAPYEGYQDYGAFRHGATQTVPQGSIYAMGDNSSHSFDSRYWGPVPKKELIGKASFVFYPFTTRWGRAR